MPTELEIGSGLAGKGFWIPWMAGFAAFPIGGGVAFAVVRSLDGALEGAIGGGLCGAVVGAAQWLVLRRGLRLGPAWVLATSAGMAAGMAIAVQLFGTQTLWPYLAERGIVAGAAIGTAQWLLLRKTIRLSFLWPPLIAVGWALGWLTTWAARVDVSQGFTVFGTTGALAFQILTGAALTLGRNKLIIQPIGKN